MTPTKKKYNNVFVIYILIKLWIERHRSIEIAYTWQRHAYTQGFLLQLSTKWMFYKPSTFPENFIYSKCK